MNYQRLADRMVIFEMHRLADFAGLYERCGRAACAQARTCRSRGIPCFDEHRDFVAAVLDHAATWDRLEGPYSDDHRRRLADALRTEDEKAATQAWMAGDAGGGRGEKFPRR